MSDDMETITVAAGRTVHTGGGWPPVAHGPGAQVRVTTAEAAQLRASGHAIDPAAQPVRVMDTSERGATRSIGVGAAEPRVNPGTIGALR